MKFIKTYGLILVLSYVFVFFGGYMLFDFRHRFYLAIAAVAFVAAVIASVFIYQDGKIAELEQRIEALERQKETEEY